ncbi:MAG: glutamine amidotransferase [Novosphingobium sp.]|nr:glutamine amidotransferase [Novosphingobium sp.]
MKRALIIRHVPYEGVAGFRAPIEAAGYTIERIDVDDDHFPHHDLTEPDLLIMMGGPMGVYEQDQHPWIACQLRRLARRLALDKPTLGVCLGAQMIAAALGAEVYPGPAKEIGFAPVTMTAPGEAGPLRHLIGLPLLHWHGDTFALPEGATILARTDLYAHQAFTSGRNVLGLQFHAEMGEDPRLEAWLADSDADLAAAGTSAAAIRADNAALGPAAVRAGRRMLGEWLEGIEQRQALAA